MPTYEYRCAACGHELEQFQSITAAPPKKCPACHKAKLQRLMGTGAGVIFRGSGFYQTDYRSESYKQAADAEKKGAATGGDGQGDSGTTEKKAPATDAKPAASGTSGDAGKSTAGDRAPAKSSAKRRGQASGGKS
jgi:putative FmdB family regulatory protein